MGFNFSRKAIDLAGGAVLAVATVASLAVVPRPAWSQASEVTTQAVYGILVTLAALAILRATGRTRAEQICLAALLAAMPLVYVRSVPAGGALWPEVIGFVLFVGIAAVALFALPALLAPGLAAHGLWDLAHLTTGPVPQWYAVACAVIDVGLGIYIASRLPAWRAAAPPRG